MPLYGARRDEGSAWRRASFCASGECVEVAQRDGMIIVRNSSEPRGEELRYTSEEWRSFILGVKAGEFDDIGAGV